MCAFYIWPILWQGPEPRLPAADYQPSKRLLDRSLLLEGKSSKSYLVLSGVPQGSVLAPLLFLIYINDITESITCTVRFYADDVLLYRVINTDADTTAVSIK